METYNVYCDESCHLENDGQTAMVLGGVWCPLDKTREINVRIREIKSEYLGKSDIEVKWTKVSPRQERFYLRLIDYFFDDDDLHFRGLVIPDKSILAHGHFGQTHDEWYYKMYFTMLKVILEPHSRFRIYLDIKDTKGTEKVAKLHDVLCNSMYDFSREVVENVQLVRSHEVEIMQLTDLLIGAISYVSRAQRGSLAKLALVDRIIDRSRYSLTKTTLYRESKLNIFVWRNVEVQT